MAILLGCNSGMPAHFPCLEDFTPETLIRMADSHDDAAFAEILGGAPGMSRVDDMHVLVTGIANPFANMVWGMNVRDAEGLVLSFTRRLLELGVPGFFWVGPCTRPLDLPRHLQESGWVEDQPCPAMVLDLDQLVETPFPQGIELRQVASAEDLRTWQEVVSIGSPIPIEVGRLMSPSFEGSLTAFTAYHHEVPVATTAVFIHDGVPGIYCVAVLPEYRGIGIGAAVTAEPLFRARQEGYRMATLQASEMGYPIYKRLGFRDVCHLRVFEFSPSEPN